ncbi:MAG: GNAT family N-acetyltransferase [Syntrophomonadaceae bacterium]|jgi:L-amino acid N-acyltransferase YncA
MDFNIDEMKISDWPQVREIYLEGIGTGYSTFEYEAPDWERWDLGHLKIGRLVARREEEVMGWVALSPVSARAAYAGVAEVSVYVRKRYWRNRIGSCLLTSLIDVTERNNIWTIQATVLQDNQASFALFTRSGFRQVGVRERIAKMKNGEWRNTLLFERRSPLI